MKITVVLKKLLSIILLALVLTFILERPSLADEVNAGNKIFTANCAACHAGGVNRIVATKSLKKTDLQKYQMDSLEAIVNQVTNGKNAMPAFKGRLKPQQIQDVATYVLEQSEKGWPKS